MQDYFKAKSVFPHTVSGMPRERWTWALDADVGTRLCPMCPRCSAGPAGRRAAWRMVDLAGLGAGWMAGWRTPRAQHRLVFGMWESV